MRVLDSKRLTQSAAPFYSLVCSSVLVLILIDSAIVAAQPITAVQPLAETTVTIGPLRFVGFSQNGTSIRVGSTQGKFQHLSSNELKPTDKLKSLPPFGIVTSALSRDHRLFVVGGWKGSVVIFDSRTDAVRAQLPFKMDFDPTAVTTVALNEDASCCVVGNRSSIVRMYRIATSEVVWESEKLDQDITGVSVSKDGKYVAVSTGVLGKTNESGKTLVLDGMNGKPKHTWLDTNARVNHVAIANDSRTLLAAEDHGVRIYDLWSGQQLHVIPELFGVQRFKFIDDTRCVLSRFPDGLSIFDLQSRRIVVDYVGHKAGVDPKVPQLIWALDVSLDGKKLASADSLGQVYVWPIP